MENTVAKVITVIGSSSESFDKAVATAVAAASKRVKGVHVADVQKFYVHVEKGKVISYRARVRMAFEYDPKFKKGR
ncbi:MAG: dodecin family protein [Dehalococcoidia bacterium]